MGSRAKPATAALVLISSCSGHPYLPAGSFAGCYVAQDAQRLQLSPDGLISADGEPVGKYRVLAPVGGKHGPLVEAEGLNIAFRNGRVIFVRGSGGFLWMVSDKDLNVVFAPDGDVQFAKGPDAACR